MLNIREKNLQAMFGMVQELSSGMDFIGRFRVMQLDENSYKARRIIGYSIVYVMFLVVCNIIVNQC